ISLAISSIMSKPAPAIIVSLLTVGFVTVAPFIVMGLGMATAANGNPGFNASKSALRYVAGFSPISLASWIFDSKTEFSVDFVTGMDRFGSLFWCLAISFVALAIACRKVKAPVERDR
ncbi:MAG TPA: hypothetical protein VL068_00495, partial [Microthrixaceae bacterium]|nr:hypothetical protein [Microthrixaceae bacterium]